MDVVSVAEGSPAQQAGIGAGDEIVAFDGFRSEMTKRLSRATPGQALRVSLFRMDELLDVQVTLAHAPRDTAVFVPDPAATEQQRELRRGWLGDLWG
jgi:predicted metalloprotease with PDZ domain